MWEGILEKGQRLPYSTVDDIGFMNYWGLCISNKPSTELPRMIGSCLGATHFGDPVVSFLAEWNPGQIQKVDPFIYINMGPGPL